MMEKYLDGIISNASS